jgi:hypothetical protein
MKIIQSYWSKPAQKEKELGPNSRNLGGWLDKKYNYMSWTLSCLQFKKFYSKVELITDQEGYDLLINKLDLPYTNVDVTLDQLNDYDPELWALGKIYAYQKQEDPFLHADGDVFIWAKFSQALENAKLFAQSYEDNYNYYGKAYTYASTHFRFVPDVIHEEKRRTNTFGGANAGIIGGNDIPFFKNYTSLALALVNQNIDRMGNLDKGMFNTFYEQHLFHCLSVRHNIPIHYEFKNANQWFDGFADFTGVPANTRYIHTITGYKKRREIGDLLEFKLKTEHPHHYYRVINLLTNHCL